MSNEIRTSEIVSHKGFVLRFTHDDAGILIEEKKSTRARKYSFVMAGGANAELDYFGIVADMMNVHGQVAAGLTDPEIVELVKSVQAEVDRIKSELGLSEV